MSRNSHLQQLIFLLSAFMDKELFDTIVNGNVDSRTQREVIEGAQRVNPTKSMSPLCCTHPTLGTHCKMFRRNGPNPRQKTGDMSQNWRLKIM